MLDNNLPKLNYKPTKNKIVSFQGVYTHMCDTCRLNDMCVKNCLADLAYCTQKVCNKVCSDCGGGPQFQNLGSGKCPAICGKSPVKDLYLDSVMQDSYKFVKRPLLQFKNKAIIMHTGLLGGVEASDLYAPDLEVIGVNIVRLWTANKGWHSRDIRDFLQVPNHIKIILFTCTDDYLLEQAMAQNFHNEDFKALGFDAWEVYELSNYGWYSRCYNIWMGFRAAKYGAVSGAWFGQKIPYEIRKDSKAAKIWSDWSQKVPQITVNCQFGSSLMATDPIAWKNAHAKIMLGLELMPGIRALWFQGVETAQEIYNLKILYKDYDCYFLSSAPWRYAQQCRAWGKNTDKCNIKDRGALMLHNQTRYVNLVNRAVNDALK